MQGPACGVCIHAELQQVLVLQAAAHVPLLAPRLGRARFWVRPESHCLARSDATCVRKIAALQGLHGVLGIINAVLQGAQVTCRTSCEAAKLRRWVQDGVGLQGAQAEYVRVPLAEATLVPVPEGVSDEQARPALGLAQGPNPQPNPCRRASAMSRRAQPPGWHRPLHRALLCHLAAAFSRA